MKFELEPDNRGRPDDELLGDLCTVANKLAVASLTRALYDEHGRFSSATLAKRFGSWNLALQMAGLVPALEQSVTREKLIADIQRIASSLGTSKLTRAEYNKLGTYSDGVIYRVFGTWKSAVTASGLEPGWNTHITDEELFENLERIWRYLGRQPRIREVSSPLSKFSADTYVSRYGGWRRALEAFVSAIEEKSEPEPQLDPGPPTAANASAAFARAHRTARTANWRLRFLTLRRDGFRCKACGRSPANEPGVELEVDHVIPWSDGGETLLENLQSLCEKCNGGKSDLPFHGP